MARKNWSGFVGVECHLWEDASRRTAWRRQVQRRRAEPKPIVEPDGDGLDEKAPAAAADPEPTPSPAATEPPEAAASRMADAPPRPPVVLRRPNGLRWWPAPPADPEAEDRPGPTSPGAVDPLPER